MPIADWQLQQRIDEICKNSNPRSWERRKAFTELLLILGQLPGLAKYSGLKYTQALDLTWEWLGLNICTFEPRSHLSTQESLERWINDRLHQQIQELEYLPEINSSTPLLGGLDENIK